MQDELQTDGTQQRRTGGSFTESQEPLMQQKRPFGNPTDKLT